MDLSIDDGDRSAAPRQHLRNPSQKWVVLVWEPVGNKAAEGCKAAY
jgi:hypothetical protein